MSALDDVLLQRCIYVSDNTVAFVRYRSATNEKWVFGGPVNMRQETLREVGREAANLESGFTWQDAEVVTSVIRECWPEAWNQVSCECQCLACRQRRDRDAEVQAMREAELPRPVPMPVKSNSLLGLFFEWLLWGGK